MAAYMNVSSLCTTAIHWKGKLMFCGPCATTVNFSCLQFGD